MNVVTRLIVSGLLLVFTLVSGVWLSNSGKPINSLILTIHKLIALGMVIFISMTVNQIFRGSGADLVQVILIVVSAVLFLALFTSGAFLSMGKPAGGIVLTIHRVAPIVVSASIALLLYRFINVWK
jgi:hypothetical protein